jgi:uracil phosphoribosyltransferase
MFLPTPYPCVFELESPIGKYLCSILRDTNCARKDFIAASNRLSTILLEGVLGEEPMVTEKRIAPTGAEYDHYLLKNPKLCYVSILRSAEAMLGQTMLLADDVAHGFILIQRNEETAMPEYYYHKFPKDLKERTVVIVDPMIGTGGSACKCIEYLVGEGVHAENIRVVNMFSVKEGLELITGRYPGVKVYTAVIDPILNDKNYMIPGVGDFGDRFFSTPH